jgi:hypothetical protein
MKKLWPYFVALVLPAMALIATAPGCAKPCNDLASICVKCGDASYKSDCEAVVNENNGSVCSAKLGTFQQYCSATGNTTSGGGSTASGGGVCGASETLCQGECVNLQSNPTFCGGCLSACADGELCAAGVCVAGCPAALPSECGGGCVDLSNDGANCGACGTSCSGDTPLCSGGTCVASCDPDGSAPSQCGSSCADVASDALHCGSCDSACPPGFVCTNGSCATQCDTGLTECCGKCVDTAADPTHCGGCAACDPGTPPACGAASPLCSNGTCKNSCDPGLSECAGGCVDVFADTSNCGGCNTVCPSGQVCSSGACSSGGCAPGQTQCGSACVNLDTSPLHCGECDSACGGTDPVCNLGVCQASCPGGLSNCGNGCVDPQANATHCGACNSGCPSGTVCDLGQCVADLASGGPGCGGGRMECDRACHDPMASIFHCGECGKGCSDKSICTADSCSAGECKNLSGAVNCDDGNPCTDEKCDAKLGCVSNGLISQSDLDALCQQTAGMDPTTQCIFCNPQGDMCNQAAPGGDCLAENSDGDEVFCHTCNVGTLTCDSTNPC